MVVFLGADGSGKSSVIERITADLAPSFRRTRYFHLRPGIGTKQHGGAPVTDPHAQPARGWVGSVAKIGYLLFDYTVGWWVKVRPLLVRSTLVIFDRYYHDILVDPRRYRYGGPMGLAGLVGRLIPKPDLWILLDAPPEVLQARKQEVPFEETTRQRDAYLALSPHLSNFQTVDAARPLGLVVNEVDDIILEHLAARTGRRPRA